MKNSKLECDLIKDEHTELKKKIYIVKIKNIKI